MIVHFGEIVRCLEILQANFVSDTISSSFQETKWYDETTVELMAPTLLPELQLLKRVKPENSCSSSLPLFGCSL